MTANREEAKLCDSFIKIVWKNKRNLTTIYLHDKFKEKAMSLWKNRVNPLVYNKDRGLSRKIMNLKLKFKYIREYKNNPWDWR